MNRSSSSYLVCLAVASIGCGLLLRGETIWAAPAPASNKTKIVGVWEVTKSEAGGVVGTTIEFTRDGKPKVTAKLGDQTLNLEGTYKVEGDKLTVTLKVLNNEMKETLTLLKLTANELITKDEKGKRDEFKKKK